MRLFLRCGTPLTQEEKQDPSIVLGMDMTLHHNLCKLLQFITSGPTLHIILHALHIIVVFYVSACLEPQ